MAPVLIGLIAISLVVSVVGLAILFRAAFWGEQDMAEQAAQRRAWRPPFLRGQALEDWAATTAEHLAGERLRGARTAQSVVQLAAEIEQRAVDAMLPLSPVAERERIVACPRNGQGLIDVTAPEVFAVADELRASRSRAEQERLAQLALANSKKIEAAIRSGGEPPAVACPLQGSYDICCTYSRRPLRCRPLQARSVAQGTRDRSRQDVDSSVEGAADSHEETVARGVAAGFRRALESAGLDGNVYELNTALTRALAIPDAADRWVAGEDLSAANAGES